jgi:hypothetical protein
MNLAIFPLLQTLEKKTQYLTNADGNTALRIEWILAELIAVFSLVLEKQES